MESMDDQEPENKRGSSTTTQLTFGKDTSKNPFTDPMKLSSKVYLESRNNTLSKTLEEYGAGRGGGKSEKWKSNRTRSDILQPHSSRMDVPIEHSAWVLGGNVLIIQNKQRL